MNDTDLIHFRSLIVARLAELDIEDVLGGSGQSTVTLDQQAVGRLSRMDALQNQAMAKATGARRGAERTRLLAALARMDEGEFGFCDVCGEQIATGRLQLNPSARLCVDCVKG